MVLFSLRFNKSNPSGFKLSVTFLKNSKNISSKGLSEFNAIKLIIWGSFIVPDFICTFIILKNEKGRNKYSSSFWNTENSLIETVD